MDTITDLAWEARDSVVRRTILPRAMSGKLEKERLSGSEFSRCVERRDGSLDPGRHLRALRLLRPRTAGQTRFWVLFWTIFRGGWPVADAPPRAAGRRGARPKKKKLTQKHERAVRRLNWGGGGAVSARRLSPVVRRIIGPGGREDCFGAPTAARFQIAGPCSPFELFPNFARSRRPAISTGSWRRSFRSRRKKCAFA